MTHRNECDKALFVWPDGFTCYRNELSQQMLEEHGTIYNIVQWEDPPQLVGPPVFLKPDFCNSDRV